MCLTGPIPLVPQVLTMLTHRTLWTLRPPWVPCRDLCQGIDKNGKVRDYKLFEIVDFLKCHGKLGVIPQCGHGSVCVLLGEGFWTYCCFVWLDFTFKLSVLLGKTA